ncbi:hypothetical protein ACTFIU_000703 [Dictyostelium citrinum]
MSTTTTTNTTPTPTPTPTTNKQKFKYLIVLDFEATCEKDVKFPNQEIIEFPSVIINTETLETVSTFREYVKPIINPNLSKFCTELTGIKQETVENAGLFPDVLKRHCDWFFESLPKDIQPDDYCFVCCGDWDLLQCLPKQLKLCNNLAKPSYLSKWINIKKQYTLFYNRPSYGMTNMLRELKIELEGRHHCGLSDSLNISKILKRMISEGCVFDLVSTIKAVK